MPYLNLTYDLGRMISTVQELETASHNEMMRRIGVLVGILFTGALLTLGTSCMFLLSSKKENSFRYRDRILRAYIVVLLFTVIAFELEAFTLSNASSIFLSQPPQKVTEITGQLNTAYGLTVVAIGGLTDGVLVSLLSNSLEVGIALSVSSRCGDVLWYRGH